MKPDYNLQKIKNGVDKKLWDKAADIYRNGKITEFEEFYAGYTALVLGSEPYDTAVSNTNFNQGNCNCFLGQQGILCKHIVALAIFAVKNSTNS